MSITEIEEAAALLDNIGSGTLTEGDFYLWVEKAGPLACALVSPLVSKKNLTQDDKEILAAAECLKDISIGHPGKLAVALATAKTHVYNLFAIADNRGARK